MHPVEFWIASEAMGKVMNLRIELWMGAARFPVSRRA